MHLCDILTVSSETELAIIEFAANLARKISSCSILGIDYITCTKKRCRNGEARGVAYTHSLHSLTERRRNVLYLGSLSSFNY